MAESGELREGSLAAMEARHEGPIEDIAAGRHARPLANLAPLAGVPFGAGTLDDPRRGREARPVVQAWAEMQ